MNAFEAIDLLLEEDRRERYQRAYDVLVAVFALATLLGATMLLREFEPILAVSGARNLGNILSATLAISDLLALVVAVAVSSRSLRVPRRLVDYSYIAEMYPEQHRHAKAAALTALARWQGEAR